MADHGGADWFVGVVYGEDAEGRVTLPSPTNLHIQKFGLLAVRILLVLGDVAPVLGFFHQLDDGAEEAFQLVVEVAEVANVHERGKIFQHGKVFQLPFLDAHATQHVEFILEEVTFLVEKGLNVEMGVEASFQVIRHEDILAKIIGLAEEFVGINLVASQLGIQGRFFVEDHFTVEQKIASDP